MPEIQIVPELVPIEIPMEIRDHFLREFFPVDLSKFRRQVDHSGVIRFIVKHSFDLKTVFSACKKTHRLNADHAGRLDYKEDSYAKNLSQ